MAQGGSRYTTVVYHYDTEELVPAYELSTAGLVTAAHACANTGVKMRLR